MPPTTDTPAAALAATATPAALDEARVVGLMQRHQTDPAATAFNLLYLTTDRPAEMEAAWARVLDLAPDSAWARTIGNHMGDG